MDTAIGIVLSNIKDRLTFNKIKDICFNCGITENEIINLRQTSLSSDINPSKTDLINEIIKIFKKKEISEQQKILICILEKIINLDKIDIETLKKDLIRFGYQLYVTEKKMNFVILKDLFDVNNLKNYPVEIRDMFIEAVNAIQNNDYNSANVKFVKCIETLANKYEHCDRSLEQKANEMFKDLSFLKNSENDSNFEQTLKSLSKNIILILSKYRNFASDAHPNRFAPTLEDVLIVKSLTEFILLVYEKGIKK